MIVTVIDSKTGASIVGALVQFIALMPPTGSDYTDTTGTVTFMPDPIGMSSWAVSAEDYTTRTGTGTIPAVVELTLVGEQPPPLGNVTIYAVDPDDPYLRDWNIYTAFPGTKIQTTNKASGNTWVTELPSGTYYFNVGQSGGAAYGTYSGTINGISFSGVDVNHAVQFTVGEVPPTTTKKKRVTGPFGLWQFPIINMLLGLC